VSEVSIPHRYGKNGIAIFQIREVSQFPFLIGTVRTNIASYTMKDTSEVSIPHRYGKNRKKRNYTIAAEVVSIPHRYGKNRS